MSEPNTRNFQASHARDFTLSGPQTSTDTDGNGLGESRKITETALQALVTTESHQKQARSHNAHQTQNGNQQEKVTPHSGQARESALRPKLTKYGPNRDFWGAENSMGNHGNSRTGNLRNPGNSGNSRCLARTRWNPWPHAASSQGNWRASASESQQHTDWTACHVGQFDLVGAEHPQFSGVPCTRCVTVWTSFCTSTWPVGMLGAWCARCVGSNPLLGTSPPRYLPC